MFVVAFLHCLCPTLNAKSTSDAACRIAFGLHKMVAILTRDLSASPLAYTQQSYGIERGLSASSVSCTYLSSKIERGLTTSSIDFTHQYDDIRHSLPPSFIAYTY